MAILDEAKYPQPRDRRPAVTQSTTAAEYRPPAPAPSYSGGGGGGGSAPAPAAAAPSGPAVDWAALKALSDAGLSSADIAALGTGGGGATTASAPAPMTSSISIPTSEPLAPMPMGIQADVMSDPALIALLAGFDADLQNQEGDYRRQQDETRRRFSDSQPMFEENWNQNRNRIKNSYEARGLLKSGGTEDAVGRSYTQQGDEWARQEAGVGDTVANLEQQIARARIANANQRAQAVASYQQSQPVT